MPRKLIFKSSAAKRPTKTAPTVPKPEHYEAFLNDVIENGKDRDPEFPHFCVRAGDEVIAVVVRDADNFEQNAQDGVVNWLDERRPMLQEYDPVNRHTIPLSGDLVE